MDEVTRRVFAGWLADQIIASTPRGDMDDVLSARLEGEIAAYMDTARYVGIRNLVDVALEDKGYKA